MEIIHALFVNHELWRQRIFNHMCDLGQQEVDEQIKTVVEAGVNFIGTANMYSLGLSETMDFPRKHIMQEVNDS